MKSDTDQIALLRRLRVEGQITEEEYQRLAGGLATSAPRRDEGRHAASNGHDTPIDDVQAHEVASDGQDEELGDLPEDLFADALEGGEETKPVTEPLFRDDVSTNHVAILLFASLVLLVGGLFGVISWWVVIATLIVLATTVFADMSKITLLGAGIAAVLMFLSLLFPGGEAESAETQQVTATQAPRDPYPPVEGSLNVYMDQIGERWNTVQSQPQVVKGLTRQNETGPYDTFIYRFGEWGRLLGAYDPANEMLYALVATGQFSGAATDSLYLHLCSVVAPFSQDCIESYKEKGLDGQPLADFADTAHQSEWALGDQTWRLEIDQNVLTIRVYGPDAA